MGTTKCILCYECMYLGVCTASWLLFVVFSAWRTGFCFFFTVDIVTVMDIWLLTTIGSAPCAPVCVYFIHCFHFIVTNAFFFVCYGRIREIDSILFDFYKRQSLQNWLALGRVDMMTWHDNSRSTKMNEGAERSSWQRRNGGGERFGGGSESRGWTVESDGQHRTAISAMRWAWKWKMVLLVKGNSPEARCSSPAAQSWWSLRPRPSRQAPPVGVGRSPSGQSHRGRIGGAGKFNLNQRSTIQMFAIKVWHTEGNIQVHCSWIENIRP